MKATLILVSLLPLLGSAQLKTIDTSRIPSELFEASPSDEGSAVARAGDSNAAAVSCPSGYPFLCAGFCCRYNICCRRSCCNWDADFCGADGLCYKWV